MRDKLGRVERFGLPTAIALAALLACFWVYRLPFYQEPDEVAHSDYVFSLYDAGSNFAPFAGRPANETAPQTRYLLSVADYRRMRYNPVAVERPDYDTRAFFRAVDARAPARSLHRAKNGDPIPYVMLLYPATYYTIALATFGAIEGVTHSITLGFFAMRSLGVIALCATLAIGYYALRAYGVAPVQSVLAIFGLGVLPLMSSVTSSLQPDTLLNPFFALTLLGAALLRRPQTRLRGHVFICIGLVALAALKQHYAAAAYAVTVPLVFLRPGRKWNAALTTLIVVLPIASYVVMWKLVGPVHPLESPMTFASRTHAFTAAPVSPMEHLSVAMDALRSGIDGNISLTYWVTFGNRGGRVFRGLIFPQIFTIVNIALWTAFTVAEIRIVRRILVVAKRRSLAQAAALVAGGYATNLFIAVTVVLIAATVASDGALDLQGRYWLPVTLAMIVIVLRTIPRGFPSIFRSRTIGATAALIAVYGLVSGTSAAFAMNAYFYGRPDTAHFDSIADFNGADTLHLSVARDVAVSGYAIDMIRGFPASSIFAVVDGRETVTGSRYRLATPNVAHVFNDRAVANSGFALTIPAKLMRRGTHRVTFVVGDSRARGLLFHRTMTIDVGDGRD